MGHAKLKGVFKYAQTVPIKIHHEKSHLGIWFSLIQSIVSKHAVSRQ